jgi:hypothetical protein
VKLPPFVNQFRDEAGVAWPPASIDGHPRRDYNSVNCGAAVGASAAAFADDAGTATSPNSVRQFARAHQVEGLTGIQLTSALRLMGYKATVLVVPPRRFGKILDDRPDLYICLLVDDDLFPGCDPAFQGDHWVGIACGRNKLSAKGEVLVPAWDPTCPPKKDQDGLPPGANWERLDKTTRAAQKWSQAHGYGNQVTMVTIKHPAPEPVPDDPIDALIATLRAALAQAEDALDERNTVLASIAAESAPYREA